MGSQVSVGEPVGQEAKDDQDAEQRLDAGVAEAQRGGALVIDDDRLADLVEGPLADVTVRADSLDLEQTPVGVKADLRSAGRFWRRLPTPKSRVSLMVVSVRRARPCLWYCLILVFL